MEKEKQFDIYKDLFLTCTAINSSKTALEDLQKVSLADNLSQYISTKINYLQTIVLSSLYSLPETDRTEIMSFAFSKIHSINLENSLEGHNSYFDKDLKALESLIDYNNQVTYIKCLTQSEEEQQSYLASLPSDQQKSFEEFLNSQATKIENEETSNQGQFESQIKLEDLQTFMSNLPAEQ